MGKINIVKVAIIISIIVLVL